MRFMSCGLNYKMKLRWDGVWSLSDAMAMLRKPVANTPLCNGCGWSATLPDTDRFAEMRLPTLKEINAAALCLVGYTRDTPNPPESGILQNSAGNSMGLLRVNLNPSILCSTLAKGPRFPHEYPKDATRPFMRQINRPGVTGVIDAGGGFRNCPIVQ